MESLSPLLVWLLPGTIGGLATVIWWLGRRLIERLDAVSMTMAALQATVTSEIALIKERLARIEGHVWPPR